MQIHKVSKDSGGRVLSAKSENGNILPEGGEWSRVQNMPKKKIGCECKLRNELHARS